MAFDKTAEILQTVVVFFIGILTPIMFIVIGNGLTSGALTFLGTGSRFLGALFLFVGVIGLIFVILAVILAIARAVSK